ncbi:hypothetical protein Tco_0802654 [Tanacetum coccineum]|uniref:Uncharacterized protein n=1 Tax=Tanacetum coccineum TaxID=301880 RepID=A0ABQ5A257_9ASTR
MGFKTYEDYKDDWIYEWNKNVPWVYDKPWLDNGIWKEPKPVEHTCKPFNYKTGCSKWPTCSWREYGYCNGGNFPGTYHIGNSLHYQDLEWYEALEDSELKDEALRNKAIMEGLIREYKNETHEEEHELCGIETYQVPVCQIKRYKMIKYSFNDEEEYVVVKEDEYDDLTITSEEACRAYQEIFRMMDEGWMVTRTEAWRTRSGQRMDTEKKQRLHHYNQKITTDPEKVAVSSSLRLLEPKRTIESRAKRSSINLVRTQHPSETMVFHNEDGNPARANIKQALGSYERPHKGVKASANSDIMYFFTSAQDGDPLQDDVRLCLGDDLKKAQDHNQRQV